MFVMDLSLFTVGDAAGSLLGTVIFAGVLVGPGYVIGWVTDVLGFRGRSLAEQIVWSLPLSLCGMTLVAVFAGKYGTLNAACWVAALLSVVAVVLGWRRGAGGRWGGKRVAATVVVAWSVFVVVELIDLGFGNKLYMSTTVFDHSVRTAFVDAVVRTGVPPHNPLYWTTVGGVGHAAPMRYYYFWYVLCAIVVKLGHVTARQSMIASCVWAGFAVVAVIALYLRHFLEVRRRRVAGVAIALLAVTGLDLLVVVSNALRGLGMDPDMEWWSMTQVTSWMDTLLWVPHHAAGLVCCLFGFLLVWMSRDRGGRQRLLCGVMAGVGFASAFGLSTYVAVAFAMVMVAWLVRALVQDRARAAVLLVAGLTASLVLMPYLLELRQAGPNAGGKTHLFALGVRPMIDPGLVADSPAGKGMAVVAFLGLGYFVELGFFALVLVVAWRRRHSLGEAGRTAIFLTLWGMVVATFVRSTVIGTNDFGIRSMLIPQFFLLLLGAMLLGGEWAAFGPQMRRVMSCSIVVGVAGTIYQAGTLRLYLPVQEKLGRAEYAELAERNMALRTAFQQMDRVIPKGAVVQYDTRVPGQFFTYSQLMNVERQTVNGVPECDTAFGGEQEACGQIKTVLNAIFAGPAAAMDAAKAKAACGQLAAEYLIATRWDAVWGAKSSWVWGLPAKVVTREVRIVECGVVAVLQRGGDTNVVRTPVMIGRKGP